MNVKKVIAAAVLALFLVPALAAAYTYSPSDYPRARETLVEGHTVFAVIAADICIDDDLNSTTYNESIDCPDALRIDADVAYDARANVTVQRLGTAVAVLVRDRVKYVPPSPIGPQCDDGGFINPPIWYENPGVLWFNDQFLVGDDLDILEIEADANVDVCLKIQDVSTDFRDIPYRYPCGGWVFATQAGNPDPRGALLPLWQYEESYFITDPNDNTWTIDKYGIAPVGANLEPVFGTVDPGNGGHGADQSAGATVPEATVGAFGVEYTGPPGSGTHSGSASVSDVSPWSADTPHWMYYIGALNMWSVPVLNAGTVDPGPTSGISCNPYVDTAPTGAAYPNAVGPNPANPDPADASAYQGNNPVWYNAVLFFFFEDLGTSSATVDPFDPYWDPHAQPGFVVHGAGAPNDGDYSFCERDDYDDCPGGDGDVYYDADGDGDEYDSVNDDHEGNSHPYNQAGGGSGPIHVHATASVDLYFSNVAPPAVGTRQYAVYDATGSAAPSHVHGLEPFDDRVRIDPCVDADVVIEYSRLTFNGGQTYTVEEYNDYYTTGPANATSGEYARYGDGQTEYGGAQQDANGDVQTYGAANTDDCTY